MNQCCLHKSKVVHEREKRNQTKMACYIYFYGKGQMVAKGCGLRFASYKLSIANCPFASCCLLCGWDCFHVLMTNHHMPMSNTPSQAQAQSPHTVKALWLGCFCVTLFSCWDRFQVLQTKSSSWSEPHPEKDGVNFSTSKMVCTSPCWGWSFPPKIACWSWILSFHHSRWMSWQLCLCLISFSGLVSMSAAWSWVPTWLLRRKSLMGDRS
jgi:hypothetical protein